MIHLGSGIFVRFIKGTSAQEHLEESWAAISGVDEEILSARVSFRPRGWKLAPCTRIRGSIKQNKETAAKL